MPQLADPEKIILLYKNVFPESEQIKEYIILLKNISEKSNVDYNFFSYRYQIFKKLTRLIKTPDDLYKLIYSHDKILKSIEVISNEDITGYHHYFSLNNLINWIKISNNIDDFLKIINSRIPHTTAKKISLKNKNNSL